MSHRSIIFATASMAGGALLGVAALVTPVPARASGPTPATSLAQAAAQGQQLFEHDKFGGHRTCDSCHINGGTTLGTLPGGGKIPSLVGTAAQFPKYNPNAHRVITLEQQIARCIQGSDGGKPPAADSVQIADLTAYLTKLSKGWIMGKQFK